MKLMGNLKTGLAFILSAPAGTGKTTLINKLKKEFDVVKPSVSFTTRAPRRGEQEGVHYHFIDKKQFEEKISKGDFLEWVELYGDYYGTSRQAVEEELIKGHHVFLVIDTQGALKLMGKWPATYIFVSPPSLEVLSYRLAKRKTETPERIDERLKIAQEELEASKYYDYQIVNDDLQTAYQTLKSIVIAEEHKTLNIQKEKNGTKRRVDKREAQ